MKEHINRYNTNDVLEVVSQTIVAGRGAISTNSCESIMSMIKEMCGKKRFCGVVLYSVRADVAILCKNQKYFTKQFKAGKLATHEHWLPRVLRSVGMRVTEAQETMWRKEELQKIKQDENNKTEEAKLDRVIKKKARYKTLQDEKKESISGTSFTYETRGGDRRLQTARENRERREFELEHTTTTSATTVTTTTVTWPKNDVRLKKIKQKDIHTYLASKISAEELDQLPTRSPGCTVILRVQGEYNTSP